MVRIPVKHAKQTLIIVGIINGNMQDVTPTYRLLFVAKQKTIVPERKFMSVPIITPTIMDTFLLWRALEIAPIIYAIRGKDRMKPPVGPIIICQPPE